MEEGSGGGRPNLEALGFRPCAAWGGLGGSRRGWGGNFGEISAGLARVSIFAKKKLVEEKKRD